MSILSELKERFRLALGDMAGDMEELLSMVRRSQDPKFGDYQANLAMPLGKRLGRPPREVAAELLRRLDLSDSCDSVEVAGPGFINLRIRDESWLAEQLTAALGDPRLGVAPLARPRRFVVDYSAPNVAKPMHVGHIRSTVIGDALCRMLKFAGHEVISDNHIGDWGTQFGMILYGYKHFLDPDGLPAGRRSTSWPGSIGRSAQLADEQPDVAAAVLAETAKLHAGDPENLRLWREFLPVCLEDIAADLPAAGRPVRPHAGRELLQRSACLGRPGTARPRHGPDQRRRRLRVSRRAATRR